MLKFFVIAALLVSSNAFADDAYATALSKLTEVQETLANAGVNPVPCNVELEKKPRPLADYLHTLNAPDAPSKSGNPWRGCYDSSSWNEPVEKAFFGSKLRSDCAPDTLYSWGSMDKIKTLEKDMGSGKWSDDLIEREIYAVGTPTGSFAYGDYPIRIKLKSGTKFRIVHANEGDDSWYLNACGQLKDGELDNTVVARVIHGGLQSKKGAFVGLEYVVCSDGPVDSWSYGTREQYDEMVKDVRYILDPANQNSNSAHGADYQTYLESEKDGRPLFFGTAIDGHEFSQDALAADFQKSLDLAKSGAGRVYVNPDSRTKDPAADLKRHFETKVPAYFNN